MTSGHIFFVWVFLLGSLSLCQADARANNRTETKTRGEKLLSVFQIVRFNNEICQSTSSGKNGTCFTAEECDNLGGSSSGSCASGYGVCCLFSLSCGETSSQNCTYLMENSITSVPDNVCTYTICKSSIDVCRIKFDFNTFTIAGPSLATAVAAAGSAIGTGGAVGDCLTDQFSITAPGGRGSPVICGGNTGQHMIVDASDECHTVSFSLSSGGSVTRSWDIKVIQYTCGDSNAGPDSCLQYFTGTSGTISSYNFPMGNTLNAATTHLSSQLYTICIRQELNRCAICYTPAIQSGAPTEAMQSSFGLSVSPVAAIAQAGVEMACSGDYISIDGAVDATAPLVIGTVPPATANRICGRVFSAVQANTDAIAYNAIRASVCTQATPFRIRVNFDDDEVATGTDAATNEHDLGPAGTVGFSLDYQQISCN